VDVQQVAAWLKRLLYLDTRVFEDVRTNPTATIPSFLVMSAAMLIAGIGGWLWWMLQDFGSDSDILVHSALIGTLAAIVLWGVWLVVVYFLLSQVFRQRVYLEQLLRVMGLATAPMALMGLMFIPVASFAIGIAALALVFGVTCVAISYVCSANPAQILVANLAGFFVWAVALTVLASGSGAGERNPHAPGIFLYQAMVDAIHDNISVANPELP
jgi:hypothetical protein